MTALLRILALWRHRAPWLALGMLVSLASVGSGVALMAVSGSLLAGLFGGAALIAPVLLRRLGLTRVVLRYLERLATTSMFVLAIGRCMFLGIFSAAMRQSLYQSGLKLKEAYRRIEELAELDELTGAFNRRCIMRMLEEEIARSRRLNTTCAIALIDLDWFKRINDAHGHPTGDEVLRTFAITMFANIRGIDRFGRYGGEEFLLVLPDTTQQSAVGMLDRLRTIIAELDWSAFSTGMRVTISAGVAVLRANENSDSVLARADSALYAAKAQGRNRINTA